MIKEPGAPDAHRAFAQFMGSEGSTEPGRDPAVETYVKLMPHLERDVVAVETAPSSVADVLLYLTNPSIYNYLLHTDQAHVQVVGELLGLQVDALRRRGTIVDEELVDKLQRLGVPDLMAAHNRDSGSLDPLSLPELGRIGEIATAALALNE